MCDGDSDVIFLEEEPYNQFKYNPVDEEWQRETCQALGLNYCGSNGIAPGGPNVSLTSPLTIRPITGDGNSFFRTF